MPLSRVLRRIREVRESRYQLLRGYFHAADEQEPENIEESHQRLQTVTIQADVSAVGRALRDLPLGGCRLTAVVRAGRRIADPSPTLDIEAGDTLVLAGTFEQVNRAATELARRRSA